MFLNFSNQCCVAALLTVVNCEYKDLLQTTTEKFCFDVSNSFSNLAYMTENFQNVVIVIVNICLTIYNIEIVAY